MAESKSHSHDSAMHRELAASCPQWPAAGELLTAVVDRLESMVNADGVLLTCGNGGSAADASHIVAELVKCFRVKRPLDEKQRRQFEDNAPDAGGDTADRLEQGIRAVSLTCSTPILTAIANDCGADLVFAQQVWALARPNDVVLGLSTSGNSENVLQAFRAAKVRGCTTIGLCGEQSCKMDGLCDLLVKAPSSKTFRIQEYHLAFYHAMCALLEQRVFQK
jgi:D-sedoheptulose 7-phosphate isomerase